MSDEYVSVCHALLILCSFCYTLARFLYLNNDVFYSIYSPLSSHFILGVFKYYVHVQK